MATDNTREREREASLKKAKKGKRRRKKKQTIAVLLILLTVCSVTLVTLSLTVFFNIEKISVSGNTKYSTEQIIDTAQVLRGDNLFLVDTDRITVDIQQKLPFIVGVTIKRTFPNELKISVKETTEKICVVKDNEYYSADYSGKIIQKYEEKPEGLMIVRVSPKTELTVGHKVIFDTEREEELFDLFFDKVEANGWQVDAINISDPYDSYFKFENRIIVKLGSSSYFEEKVSYFKAGIPNLNSDAVGVFDLSGWTPKNNQPVLKQEDISSYNF